MSSAMNNLKNRLVGKVLEGATEPAAGGASPMLVGLMKSFGISPDAITEYAESIKNAVNGKLSSIDDKLDNILSIVHTNEMKLAEIESNQRVILDVLKDSNEDQFAQMAEHPLDVPPGKCTICGAWWLEHNAEQKDICIEQAKTYNDSMHSNVR